VLLRVSPWGKVRVDHASMGTTPPLTQLELSEGQHQIDISNPASPTVSKVVQVKKGEPVVINHKFE
jgi:non-specific serine/threonine protein kinase